MLSVERICEAWQAQIFGEDMPGYEADVGARASTTAGRKERKRREEARGLIDMCAELKNQPEDEGDGTFYPEHVRKRPAGNQPSVASNVFPTAGGSVASSSRD